MLGKPLDTLVPEPMGTVHNMFIERYIETGERNALPIETRSAAQLSMPHRHTHSLHPPSRP